MVSSNTCQQQSSVRMGARFPLGAYRGPGLAWKCTLEPADRTCASQAAVSGAAELTCSTTVLWSCWDSREWHWRLAAASLAVSLSNRSLWHTFSHSVFLGVSCSVMAKKGLQTEAEISKEMIFLCRRLVPHAISNASKTTAVRRLLADGVASA